MLYGRRFDCVYIRNSGSADAQKRAFKAVTLVLIKLLLYGAAAVLLVFVFPKSLYACLIGYAAGLPLATVGWFIYYTVRTQRVKSGDDKNESNNNN